MKIYVIGSGAMGSLFAASLAHKGEDVTLVARNEEVAERINRDGLKITGLGGEYVAAVKVLLKVDSSMNADAVFVCVKAYDTAEAMRQHIELVKNADSVISLQNGIGNVEEIAAQAGDDKVLAGSTTMGAFVAGVGIVHHAGVGDTIIGRPKGGPSPKAEKIAAVMSAANLPTVVSENIKETLWNKLCVNVGINAACALLRIRNGRLIQHDSAKSVMMAAVEEALQVAEREGVRIDADEMKGRVMQVARKTSDNKSSMLTDILHGRRTEIDYINGAVARIGKRHGVETPVNETLTNLIIALHETRSERVTI